MAPKSCGRLLLPLFNCRPLCRLPQEPSQELLNILPYGKKTSCNESSREFSGFAPYFRASGQCGGSITEFLMGQQPRTALLRRSYVFHKQQQHNQPFPLSCQHRAHFSRSSSSADSEADSASTFGGLPAEGKKRKNALVCKLQDLCKASDQETLHALEVLIPEIKPSDDPEGLLPGAVYLKLASGYGSSQTPDIPKGLFYAKKATAAYATRGPSLKLATCLYVSALIHVTMGDCNGAVNLLKQSGRVMKKIKVTPCDKYCVALKHDVQTVMGEACDLFCNEVNFEVEYLFGVAKFRLGLCDEATAHMRKSVRLKEKILQAESPELTSFYLEAANGFKLANDHLAATKLCKKALKGALKCYGSNSPEEAKARSLLSNVYYELGKYEESLSESKSARQIWKLLGMVEELIPSNLNEEKTLVCLQRWSEALLRLEEVIQDSERGNKFYTIALILAARICLLSNQDSSAIHYCKRALEALEHQEPCEEVAAALKLLSLVYDAREEFQEAVLMYKKAKEIYDQCIGNKAFISAAEIEGRIGCLLVHVGEHEEAIPHLQSCISNLKHVTGKNLLYAHFYLGVAYPQVQKYHEALEHFEAAKGLSYSTGISISMQVQIHDNLAATYSVLNRLAEAIECQKVVVNLVKENKVENYTLEEVEMRLASYIRKAEALKETIWHSK